MTAHFWLFPWLALTAGASALLLGCLAARSSASPSPPPLPRALLIFWLLVIALATVGSLRLGGTDFAAARGLLLGALGGAALAGLCRRGTQNWAAQFGLSTALVATGRLWLTHGEMSGLTALALGTALSVLCLGVAPSLLSSDENDRASSSSIFALLYVVCLAATVALGFTRAASRGEMFWADIPLLLGAGLALGTALSAGLAARQSRPLLAALPILAAGLLVVLPLSRIAHSWRPLELLLLGVLVFGLLRSLSVSSDDTRLEAGAGLLVVLVGATLAFALWSGYGLGLFALGGWFAVGAERRNERMEEMTMGAGMGFAALLLTHRLAILQNNPAVRASGPGDTWDLLAIGLGALVPLAAAEWARRDVTTRRLPGPAVVALWLLSLLLPALLLDYIWQPRSVTGVLLGAALGALLMGMDAHARRRQAVLLVSSVVFALAVLLFLPVLQALPAATRYVRVGLVLVAAAVLLARRPPAPDAEPLPAREGTAAAGGGVKFPGDSP